MLDQNLDFDGSAGTILGTELCRELRSSDFNGLIVIASANDDSESRDEFLRAGANRAVGKTLEEHAALPKYLAEALDELSSSGQALATQGAVRADYWLPTQRISKRRNAAAPGDEGAGD